jgi:hypothetical protein
VNPALNEIGEKWETSRLEDVKKSIPEILRVIENVSRHPKRRL